MRSVSRIWHLAALAAGALVAAADLAGAAPRTVLHGGSVFTGDPAVPWAQAIAIEGDRIVAVGSDDQLLAGLAPDATRIDLGHRLVVPGFNDAHVHVVVPEGNYLNLPDFAPGPGPTLAEVQRLLATGAAYAPPGSWLFVFVGSHIFDDPQATRLALDSASPWHPVALLAWHGHGTWLNTRALAALRISLTEPDPAGGHFRRFPGEKTITGEAHEYAEFMIRRRLLARVPDDHLVTQYQAFAAAAVRLGYTSLQDMAVGLPHDRALSVLAAARLPLRVRSICVPLALGEPCRVSERDLVRASGVKWFADGTPIERLAFVTDPYADRPDEVGLPDLLPDAVLARLSAHARGPARAHQLLFHSVGDAAIDEILDAMDETGGARTWRNRRLRIEHGDLLLRGDPQRIHDLGVVIVQNPTHFSFTQLFAQRFVPAVLGKLSPMRSLVAAGIPLAIGSDAIGAPQSPFLHLYLATVHPAHPAEAITLREAVIAFTRGAAYAEFEDQRKGVLAPGQLADLAVLSQDIFQIAPTEIPRTTSELTMVAGRVVWSAGTLRVPSGRDTVRGRAQPGAVLRGGPPRGARSRPQRSPAVDHARVW